MNIPRDFTKGVARERDRTSLFADGRFSGADTRQEQRDRLHDFSDIDHAIVDIRNGIVSGRKVGGPATDLALKIMHDPKYCDLPFITGYEGRGAGGKTLESAMYFIREGDEAIVGMLCVNTDLSTVRSINAMAQQLMACFDAVPR